MEALYGHFSAQFSAGLLAALLTPCCLENVALQELALGSYELDFKSAANRISDWTTANTICIIVIHCKFVINMFMESQTP